eukprot:1157514-Pelagomonas_calceolata.AAC.15
MLLTASFVVEETHGSPEPLCLLFLIDVGLGRVSSAQACLRGSFFLWVWWVIGGKWLLKEHRPPDRWRPKGRRLFGPRLARYRRILGLQDVWDPGYLELQRFVPGDAGPGTGPQQQAAAQGARLVRKYLMGDDDPVYPLLALASAAAT